MQETQIKQKLQYLKVLKTKKQDLISEQKDLEGQIAHLRKNPTDKLTNDLYIFQYNKQIDAIKEQVSATNKEISALVKELEGCDFSLLQDDDQVDYFEEINQLSPQNNPPSPSPSVEETVENEQEQPTSQHQIKTKTVALLSSFISVPKLVLLAITIIASLWILCQIDVANIVSFFASKTRFKIISFALLGCFCANVTAYFNFKDITKKSFGCFSDFFALYSLFVSLGILGCFLIDNTTFKLLVFAVLLAYCLIYFTFRILLYGTDFNNNLQNKPIILRYYYALFNKYNPLVFAMIIVVLGCVLYLTISTYMIPSWLKGVPKNYNGKLFMIINIILLSLALVYSILFSVLRIKETSLKVIDAGCLITQLFCLEFAFLCVKYHSIVGAFTYVFFALLLLTSIAITSFRIITFDKNEI